MTGHTLTAAPATAPPPPSPFADLPRYPGQPYPGQRYPQPAVPYGWPGYPQPTQYAVPVVYRPGPLPSQLATLADGRQVPIPTMGARFLASLIDSAVVTKYLAAIVPGLGSLYLALCDLSPLFDGSGHRRGWHDKAAGTIVTVVPPGVRPPWVRPVRGGGTGPR